MLRPHESVFCGVECYLRAKDPLIFTALVPAVVQMESTVTHCSPLQSGRVKLKHITNET